MKIDLYRTLMAYHGYVRGYNSNKCLSEQLRNEIYTGHLLISLLHDNQAQQTKSRCILETNIYSLTTLTNIHSIKTISSHLKALKTSGVIREIKVKTQWRKIGLYEITFESSLIQMKDTICG